MYAEEKCAPKEKRCSSSTFSKKCSHVFSSLVRSKLSSKPPSTPSSSKAVQEFNFLGNSTPNIVHAINSGVFHMEEDVVVGDRPEVTFSPLTKRSSSSCTNGEDRRHRKYRCNSLSSKLENGCTTANGNPSLKTPKSERLRTRNEPVVEVTTEYYETPLSGIRRTNRSNSAHALANSMYSTYSAGVSNRQPCQPSARNSLICASNPHHIPLQGDSECHVGNEVTNHHALNHDSSCNHHYDRLNNYYQRSPVQNTQSLLQTSFSSQSLPRRKNLGQAVATSITTAPFPTTKDSSSSSCIGRFDLKEPPADRHKRQIQLDSNLEKEISPAERMFLGNGSSSNRAIQKAGTAIGNNPNYTYLSSSQQPYAQSPKTNSQSRNLNSSFIGGVEYECSRQNLTSPSHQRYLQPSGLVQPHKYDDYQHTPQYSNAAQSSSSSATGTPPSSVENYGFASNPRSGGENVFNADYSSAGGMPSYPTTESKNSIRKKTHSSNKLSSVFGRHSKVLTSSGGNEAAHNAAWSIDHHKYNADKSSNPLESVLHTTSPNNNNDRTVGSYESNSIVLYNSHNHRHPTAIEHPSCSNSMSRSSSTQGFIGREYFEAPQLYAGNHLMSAADSVRRSATNQELTEPIIVLAKQLGNKEVEIDRLKSQLNRRSSRNESRLAQYEDELSYSRDQASKLKTKLRLCEAECAALKAKKEELEKRLETITTNYEHKLEAAEKENVAHRKEFTRLQQLEEVYEKYLDEKEWIEKHTDSLNNKLDETESSLHISEQECQHLKLELERLKDTLKDKEAEICELINTSKAVISSESEEEEEMLLTGIQQKCSLKDVKRRGNKMSKQSTPKPIRPNVLLTPTSKSCSGLHLASRSCSSTPDSVTAPASITSSGVSSFVGGKSSSEHNHYLNASKHMQRCHKKMNDCQRRIATLLEATQRIANGGRPTKNDIIGSASESEADYFDYDQFTQEGGRLNERAVEKALETHCSHIAKLYQNIEALHGSLLAAYGRNNIKQEVGSSRDPNSCRVH